jgi:hypothetical protein
MSERAAVSAGLNRNLAPLVFMIGHWQPKIGDPSFMGWFTVFSYYACGGLSLLYFLKARSRLDTTGRRFAMVMTGLLFFLGLIKNFNLLSAVTEIGRLVAGKGGWLESRRLPQLALMSLVIFGLVIVFVRAARKKSFFQLWKNHAPELVCLAYLCVFVLLRAISLHQYGVLLSREVFGIRVNWIAELAGIYALVIVLLMRMLGKKTSGWRR